MSILSFFRKTALWIVLSPVALIFTGAALNQAVLIANDGKFPVMATERWIKQAGRTVDENGMFDSVHCVMTKDTHLNFLADIFNLGSIESIGDLLIESGDWSLKYAPTVWLVVASNRLRKQE